MKYQTPTPGICFYALCWKPNQLNSGTAEPVEEKQQSALALSDKWP
jgi:hypothetical protein